MALRPLFAAGLAGATPAAIPALVCTLAKTFNINSDSFFDLTSAVEERLRKGPSAPPRNVGQSPSSWVQSISDEASECKREREDAPIESSKYGRVDGGGSSSGGALPRAFVSHLQDVKASQRPVQEAARRPARVQLAPLDRGGGLLAARPARALDDGRAADRAVGPAGDHGRDHWHEGDRVRAAQGLLQGHEGAPALFHMYLSGKLDTLARTAELEFIVPVLKKKMLAKLLALVVVRIYYPSGEVPSCLVNMELTDLAKAFMNKVWKGCLDFPNQLHFGCSAETCCRQRTSGRGAAGEPLGASPSDP
eukprot:538161-Prymnesium_polylepis.1